MKMKKVAAIVLATTMVMGSSLTVSAAAGDGAADGTGTNEGHVDKEVINVILPTTQAGQASPFDFITDPERLIQDTAGSKYKDFTFPTKDSDTGVYFQVGDNTYANTSEALQIINKSSVNVTVTVKVKATPSADSSKDIPLASSVSTTKAAPLFLNLTVGKTPQAISTTEATVTKTIAGMANNFEVVYDSEDSGGKYKYEPKASASEWKALELTMNGAINNEYVAAADTTVPKVSVTWEYDKAADSASVDTTDQVDYITGPSMTVTPSGLITMTNFMASNNKMFSLLEVDTGDNRWDVTQEPCTWNTDAYDETSGGTVTCQLGATWVPYLAELGKPVKFILTLTDGTTVEASATITN